MGVASAELRPTTISVSGLRPKPPSGPWSTDAGFGITLTDASAGWTLRSPPCAAVNRANTVSSWSRPVPPAGTIPCLRRRFCRLCRYRCSPLPRRGDEQSAQPHQRPDAEHEDELGRSGAVEEACASKQVAAGSGRQELPEAADRLEEHLWRRAHT